jgi:hypothetical protein
MHFSPQRRKERKETKENNKSQNTNHKQIPMTQIPNSPLPFWGEERGEGVFGILNLDIVLRLSSGW